MSIGSPRTARRIGRCWGLMVGANGTLVVDAGNSPSHAQVLLDHLAAAKLAPPRYLVLTHWHWDHLVRRGCI